MLPCRYRLTLGLQQGVVWGCSLILYALFVPWLRWVRRYRVLMLRRTRKQYRDLWRRHAGPLLICPNHLTLIDSIILAWMLMSPLDLLLHPSRFPWHFPEKRNFFDNLLYRALCYLGKSVPVVRGGTPSETRLALDKLHYLLSRDQAIEVFPEGTRSRSGRVDTENFAYVVGRLFLENPGTRILCVYLRGQEEETWSDFPKRGETFSVECRLLEPRTDHPGLRGARDIATQVVRELADMERRYFEEGESSKVKGERKSSPSGSGL